MKNLETGVLSLIIGTESDSTLSMELLLLTLLITDIVIWDYYNNICLEFLNYHGNSYTRFRLPPLDTS